MPDISLKGNSYSIDSKLFEKAKEFVKDNKITKEEANELRNLAVQDGELSKGESLFLANLDSTKFQEKLKNVSTIDPYLSLELESDDNQLNYVDESGKNNSIITSKTTLANPELSRVIKDIADGGNDYMKIRILGLSTSEVDNSPQKANFIKNYNNLNEKQKSQVKDLFSAISNSSQPIDGFYKFISSGAIQRSPNILDSLIKLKDTTISTKIDKGELIGSLMKDIGEPFSLVQGNHNTCAETSIQKTFVSEKPVSYVKMITELASKGTYTNSYGTKLKADPDAQITDKSKEYSYTNLLFQSALMDKYKFINIKENPLQNLFSSHSYNNNNAGGLVSNATVKALKELLNHDYKEIEPKDFKDPKEFMSKIIESAKSGNTVFLGVNVPLPASKDLTGHMITLEFKDGQFKIYDPNDKGAKVISEEELKKIIPSGGINNHYKTIENAIIVK